MIQPDAFVAALDQHGYRFACGVPCSTFTGVLHTMARHDRLRYRPAANEGAALAMAAGARLAGEPAVVLVQNSGFGNLVNPLTSLVLPYRIPVLVVMSMRGWPTPDPEEPQHYWMGRVVPDWLASLDVPYTRVDSANADIEAIVGRAAKPVADGRTTFLLVAPGTFAAGERPPGVPRPDDPDGISRWRFVRTVLAEVGGAAVICTTGYLSRELFSQGDRQRNLYLQGAMGHAAALGLGAALAAPHERVVVLDGDGALVMHMGVLAAVGHFAPPNLLHMVFDNNMYESTGAQEVPSAATVFHEVAKACGYQTVHRVTRVEELRKVLREALDAAGPTLIVCAGLAGGDVGGRASGRFGVTELTRRFSASLAETSAP